MSSNQEERWLISSTDWPEQPYSVSSACAFCKTGSGSIEGPALKLNTLAMVGFLLFKVGFITL